MANHLKVRGIEGEREREREGGRRESGSPLGIYTTFYIGKSQGFILDL